MPLTTIQIAEARDLHRYATTDLDQLATMAIPLSLAQAEQLIVRFGAEAAQTQLERMNNRVGLAENYRSVYLTCIKWFQIDAQRGYSMPSVSDLHKADYDDDDDAPAKPLPSATQEFLGRHPVGSTIDGRYYVTNESMIEDKLKHGFTPITLFINNYKGL